MVFKNGSLICWHGNVVFYFERFRSPRSERMRLVLDEFILKLGLVGLYGQLCMWQHIFSLLIVKIFPDEPWIRIFIYKAVVDTVMSVLHICYWF